MAEGLKMFYARDARNIHSHIPVADIKESERDRLICEFCPAKISWVKAHKRNGKKISWNDFFYDEDRYPTLFKKAAKIAHPVAILITVKKAREHINTERSNFYALKGELCTLEHEDKSKEFFAPSLTCNDTTFFENLGAKDEIIVVGKVRPTTNHWGEGKIYKNLNINIFNKKQITRLKD